jgi:TRAP-type mannitol/chloroaromatic compound transport system permease large subunit
MIADIINPATLGFILVAVMLFAIFVGFPISFTLIFLGFFFGYLGFGPLVFYLMTLQFSMVMTEQALAAVPLFVFMGIMMEQAGLMERLFSSVQLMLAKVRGSLYYAVLFVSVIFAAATGIVGASVTILGIMAAKSMNRSGYNVRLAAGTITAGGTLGILIPPSIMLVVMGPIMEIPVICGLHHNSLLVRSKFRSSATSRNASYKHERSLDRIFSWFSSTISFSIFCIRKHLIWFCHTNRSGRLWSNGFFAFSFSLQKINTW